ncbi:enoyl-CoA hydratase [Burkholderia ubonensis]|uniref:enoyl-CoA hydratase-related protein n=1 Tax=Burkholderia ubonensis TaxID=101571 RepID=UPI000754173A|nr:enoyl-CoA hydratase-related protein [Burkholderia ubonensis]KWE50850.1 enoyl-CoA hydratase [Burkholderia ubonensis]KWE74472.1 enoyl-CoA hydratase [Burkholderia ubonensis]KWE81562.1 enoyl-CoA hydratase [Burkholderia ubonensis]
MAQSLSVGPFETISYEKKGTVAYVTLNRPKVLNALNQRAIGELRVAFEAARDDSGVSGVIVTGAGDRAFIAGADIGELADATPVEVEQHTRDGQALLNLVESLGKPVIAAVNGLALGGGCETALACTIRLAISTAKFGQPEIKLGLIPGFGGTQRLARLVGKGVALQLILTGETITAEEALRIGLVNEIVEPSRLFERAEALLAQIAANAPLAVRYAMAAVNRGLDGPLSEGLALEGALFALCASTEDKAEGTRAFLEKRPPKFTGS